MFVLQCRVHAAQHFMQGSSWLKVLEGCLCLTPVVPSLPATSSCWLHSQDLPHCKDTVSRTLQFLAHSSNAHAFSAILNNSTPDDPTDRGFIRAAAANFPRDSQVIQGEEPSNKPSVLRFPDCAGCTFDVAVSSAVCFNNTLGKDLTTETGERGVRASIREHLAELDATSGRPGRKEMSEP